MSNTYTREQVWARDEQGVRHAVTVIRAAMPGSPHLQGMPRFSWGAGRSLTVVDDQAGVLQCDRTKQRLTVEGWGD